MTWRGRLAGACLASVLTVCGCLGNSSILSSSPARAAPSAPASVQADNPTPVAARSQKPETPNGANKTLCLLSLPVEQPSEAKHAQSAAAICAVVNGELLLWEEVRWVMKQLQHAGFRKNKQELYNDALDALIAREVLLQDGTRKLEHGGKTGTSILQKIQQAARENFDKHWLKPVMKDRHYANHEALDEDLRKAGISLAAIRRMNERKFISDQYLYSQVDQHLSRIGHAEISEYYNDHRDEFTRADSVQWQDIFIDVKRHASPKAAHQFADSLVERGRQGEDFAKLSWDYDDGECGRFRKGEGQGHKHGEIFPAEAEPLLFRLRDGDVDIVNCRRGLHVVRLVKRQYAGPIPFDAKVQKDINNKLRDMVFKREKESLVRQLKFKAVIERCEQPPPE